MEVQFAGQINYQCETFLPAPWMSRTKPVWFLAPITFPLSPCLDQRLAEVAAFARSFAFSTWDHLEVSWNRATPSHHLYFHGMFDDKTIQRPGGTPMTMETSIYHHFIRIYGGIISVNTDPQALEQGPFGRGLQRDLQNLVAHFGPKNPSTDSSACSVPNKPLCGIQSLFSYQNNTN